MSVFPVAGQRMPLGLLVEMSCRQFQYRFAEKIVRVVLPVVPHGYFQRPFPQLWPPDSVVDERLVPLWIVRVRQRLRSSLRLFAASGHELDRKDE